MINDHGFKNATIFFEISHKKGNEQNRLIVKNIGDFYDFKSVKEETKGIYKFSGSIYSHKLNCTVPGNYLVDARQATIDAKNSTDLTMVINGSKIPVSSNISTDCYVEK